LRAQAGHDARHGRFDPRRPASPRPQATAKTFLQYAIEKTRDGKLLEALMQGEHKVSMTRDARGHTALSAAIARTRKKAVRLLLTAIVEGRISRIPDSMGPVLECFVPLCACSAARTSARLGSGA
jgi:hypothetical protein